MSFRTVVLPALGGATMRQRWPLPRGEGRSTTRVSTRSVSVRLQVEDAAGREELARRRFHRNRRSVRSELLAGTGPATMPGSSPAVAAVSAATFLWRGWLLIARSRAVSIRDGAVSFCAAW